MFNSSEGLVRAHDRNCFSIKSWRETPKKELLITAIVIAAIGALVTGILALTSSHAGLNALGAPGGASLVAIGSATLFVIILSVYYTCKKHDAPARSTDKPLEEARTESHFSNPLAALEQLDERLDHLQNEQLTKRNLATITIQSACRKYVVQLAVKKLQHEWLAKRELTVIKIQCAWRRHLAYSKLQILRKEKLEQQQKTILATKIQSVFRGYKSRLRSSALFVKIVDAKDSGISCENIRQTIKTLTEKELKHDVGMFAPAIFIRNEYFEKSQMAPGAYTPETILLALFKKNVIGFIITAKRRESKLTADTGDVAYLAVDSTRKRAGIGTLLMLAVMRKTKELGKRYLTLEYIAEGSHVTEERGKAKIEFYNSFSTKFGIPMEESQHWLCRSELHIHPLYDLKDVDFDSIEKSLK